MATYERKEIVTRRVEYTVPTGAYGACSTEVWKAINAARQELIRASQLPAFAELAEDQIRVRPGDDSIVIVIELPPSKLERSA